MVQQQLYDVIMSLLGSNVQRSVELYGGSVRRRSVVQQQRCTVHGTEPCRYV